MSKILSQAEIDALLSVGTQARRDRATDAAGTIVRYDFRRPDRVPREQIHALQFLPDRDDHRRDPWSLRCRRP